MITLITLKEWVSQIYINKNTELPRETIRYNLLMARGYRKYVQFNAGRYYIIVTFNRDNTIRINSNYTYNLRFNKELYLLDKHKYELSIVTNFIYIWINRIRKIK